MLNPVSEFAIRAGEKLRAGRAWQALVFAHTSPFRPGKSYSKAISLAARNRPADGAAPDVQSTFLGHLDHCFASPAQVLQPTNRL